MNKYVKCIITLVIGIVISMFLAISRKFYAQENLKETFLILSDSFFVVGVVISGLGALVFVSNEGAFDMLSYGMMSFLGLFKSKKEKKYDSYYDYKQQKAKNKMDCGFLLLGGLMVLAISVLMYILYFNA